MVEITKVRQTSLIRLMNILRENCHTKPCWGPIDYIPFKGLVALSPLSTRPTRDSEARWVIMDCSWPIGVSLNDGISKYSYDGEDIKLQYPTIDQLCKHLHDMAAASPEPIYLYKEDLDFRQLFANFSSASLLGFKWRGKYYFDLVMMVGCRIAPYICQRTTNCITYIHESRRHFLLNYVDDFLGAEYRFKVQEAHSLLIELLQEVGISRSAKKLVPPTQQLEFIGNLVDANAMTLGVIPTRCQEIVQQLEVWRYKSSCTHNQLEITVSQ